MTTQEIRSLAPGANQHELRNHNERLILSLIQRHGALPGSEIARRSRLSPQTVSVILRCLTEDGLLQRGTPQRGKVGKPSVPIALNPMGAVSIGLTIGRRRADLMLMDFSGGELDHLSVTYAYPLKDEVFSFLKEGLVEITKDLAPDVLARISGLGVATPYELWNWHEAVGAPEQDMAEWKDLDIAAEVAKFSDLPVCVENDATAACRAEHAFGRGKEFKHYAYFYIGSFVGGGIVLNHRVFEGGQSNAGAFGSLPMVAGENGAQLIDAASLYLLENRLSRAGQDPTILWQQPLDWSGISEPLDAWIEDVSQSLAQAALTVCAVVDFEAVFIDGAFPAEVRASLARKTCEKLDALDSRGLIVPLIEEGSVGEHAMTIGAAASPLSHRFLLDSHVGCFS